MSRLGVLVSISLGAWIAAHAAFAAEPHGGDEALVASLLVARPGMPDPNFNETVVLILSHGETGTQGLVINRPSGVKLSHVLPKMAALRQRPDLVFFGGPVKPRTLRLLVRAGQQPHGARQVFDDVWVADDPELLEQLVTSGVEELRVFAGYAGWGAGQLEAELDRGDWHVVPARANFVFSPHALEVWRALLPRDPRLWSRLTEPSAPEAWTYSVRITTDSIVSFSRGRPLEDPKLSIARSVLMP